MASGYSLKPLNTRTKIMFLRYIHGQMHPNQSHATNFSVDPLSLLSYLRVSNTHPVNGNLPVITLVAAQQQTHLPDHAKYVPYYTLQLTLM